MREFKAGRESVFDAEREGRLRKISENKLDQCHNILLSDRRSGIRELSQRLNVSYGSAQGLLQELGVRKLCSRFVPKFLTAEMCQRRFQCCKSNLEVYE